MRDICTHGHGRPIVQGRTPTPICLSSLRLGPIAMPVQERFPKPEPLPSPTHLFVQLHSAPPNTPPTPMAPTCTQLQLCALWAALLLLLFNHFYFPFFFLPFSPSFNLLFSSFSFFSFSFLSFFLFSSLDYNTYMYIYNIIKRHLKARHSQVSPLRTEL